MKKIKLLKKVGSFAENKDTAAEIRDKEILPTLASGNEIEIDFTGVTLTTQSFIHALISEPLRKRGEDTLEVLSFRGCNDAIRGIIETVVQYVLDTTDG